MSCVRECARPSVRQQPLPRRITTNGKEYTVLLTASMIFITFCVEIANAKQLLQVLYCVFIQLSLHSSPDVKHEKWFIISRLCFE